MFCHNCGAQLPENAAFCPNCGQKITPISQPVSIQKPEAPPAEPVDAPWIPLMPPTRPPQPDPQPGPQTDNTVPPLRSRCHGSRGHWQQRRLLPSAISKNQGRGKR
ncbi:MAG: zinc-ribbon domain-containing protein [Evtepia sp.]